MIRTLIFVVVLLAIVYVGDHFEKKDVKFFTKTIISSVEEEDLTACEKRTVPKEYEHLCSFAGAAGF